MVKTHSLQHIQEALKKKFKGKKLVFGHGLIGSKIAFVGESPDEHEEREGKAFAGPSGQLLNQFLRKANIDPRKVYVTHILKYRPSPDRVPTLKEIKANVPFLKEEIKTIGPKVVVTLGTMALSGIGLKLPLGNVHGKVFHFGDYSLLPTYHPAHGQSDPQIGSIINLELAKIKELLAQKNEEA
ncbi:MAG: hypothetical protein A2750_00600 [Candidatus Yanofskybacteria bacterium RIFCSPHIGHO2_01_FULL_45_42]|uniref:Uracil-DNA glycosylase-like domain-containing protein n=3 Tax=Candidatus Yanofskyibacteriota TaxID=1752733 RepID=A0A1F8F575_9BACT|nr:MAG: hypothetical protein A2750_00600 [Candidatus Yanofskybacteria bacterium RIFCSPHIGHO2_01_FULL_45_42]OGN16379.1 MAG: hypothetical protein A3C81_02890 [Candidatus Yanofskybacteria bacterium RIFCSPHIGHO2_02_FULL_46_19]OGN27052.1 MAG: hypothetical protein A3B17_02380 [Candidatus Yanofskybacteria bacterium RIFCSPLOWO2_01_FULL_45_72]OGN32370.1 MAG: hypothetical protein A3J01_00390 [Candidatus Yanofskybacteria bacterium RIFCSPLOWO2_02_FULL_45_18]